MVAAARVVVEGVGVAEASAGVVVASILRMCRQVRKGNVPEKSGMVTVVTAMATVVGMATVIFKIDVNSNCASNSNSWY